jgi:hypothetical protein
MSCTPARSLAASSSFAPGGYSHASGFARAPRLVGWNEIDALGMPSGRVAVPPE